MNVRVLFKGFNVAPGVVGGENNRTALGLDLYHLHVRQQPQGPPDGLRGYAVLRCHDRSAVNTGALRQFSAGNAGGKVQCDLQILCGYHRMPHDHSFFPELK